MTVRGLTNVSNGDYALKITHQPNRFTYRKACSDMSWNVYGRASEERARDAVENLSAIMEIEAGSVPFVHRRAVGEEQESATPSSRRDCASIELAPALGLEPRTW